MQTTPYVASSPILVHAEADGWSVHWDREAETAIVHDFFSSRGTSAATATLRNISSEGVSRISEAVARMENRKWLKTYLYSGNHYVWCALAGAIVRDHGVLPARLGEQILKYTGNGNAVIYTRSDKIRRASAAIRRYMKRDQPILLGEACKYAGITLSSDVNRDVVTDLTWIENRVDHQNFAALFTRDIIESPVLAEYVAGYLVSIDPGSYFYGNGPSLPNDDVGLRIIMGSSRPIEADSPSSFEISGSSMTLTGPLLTASETKDFLRPVWASDGKDFMEEIAANLINSAASHRRGANVAGAVFSENDLTRSLNLIRSVIQEKDNELPDAEISPRPALVDATVYSERIQIQGSDVVSTPTPLEELDVLREHYLKDVARLRDDLAGSNSGQGFLHRLDALASSLERPLSDASSLLVATQVRALEDMLPSMQEIVADVTAADVGATVVGLGLYARQFPAWNRFLENAQLDRRSDFESVRDAISKDLDELRAVLDAQPDALVDPELKAALAEISDAAQESNDAVLEFGFMRALGNVYRAVARYLKERRDNSVEKFNAEIEGVIAKQGVNLVVSGVMFAASVPLLNMASAMPNEFGWFLAIFAMINFAKK